MLTIFGCPRSFMGEYAVIQWNALRSWTLLSPRPQILLFGNDQGTAEVAHELGVLHVPMIKRNEAGTPLLDDLWAKAEAHSDNPFLAYVNSDIILMNDFLAAAAQAAKFERKFLLGGRRWDLRIHERLQFESGWADRLREKIAREGVLAGPKGIDYFIFPRGMWGRIPPFALGRWRWDNWLLYRARALGAWLIDATTEILAVHQLHAYPLTDAEQEALRHREVMRNLELLGSRSNLYTLNESTHKLTAGGVRRSISGTLRLHWMLDQWKDQVWTPVWSRTRPLRRALGLVRSRS